MKFYKVTASKYIGTDGYTLRKGRDGSFSIFKDSVITEWGTSFTTVRSAENFLERHDYIHASIDKLPISKDDLEALKEIYNFKEIKPGLFKAGNLKLIVPDDFNTSHQVMLESSTKNIKRTISCADTLFRTLDKIGVDSVFASVVYRGTDLRDSDLDYIFAKKSRGGAGGATSRLKQGSGDYEKQKRRTPQEISRNLIRVKSSNVWAYGVEIKDRKDKVGDVYVQFKGKNGGPDGGLYVYYDVPITIWRRILSYPSKGAAIWKFLRNNYMYSKLTGDKRGRLPNAINH